MPIEIRKLADSLLRNPITVNVAPVLGERITTNNHATYTVTFQ